MVPTVPTDDKSKKGGGYEWLPRIKRVIDYSGLGYEAVLELPCDTFQQMLKNQIVDSLNESEEGRKYLADAERFKQTAPDIEGLKRNFSD